VYLVEVRRVREVHGVHVRVHDGEVLLRVLAQQLSDRRLAQAGRGVQEPRRIRRRGAHLREIELSSMNLVVFMFF
jgi:hypothetical protein